MTCSESDTYLRVGQHSVTSPMLYPIFEECFASYMQQAHLLGGQARYLTTRMPVPREIAWSFDLAFTD
jgi:hypothetical protein